MGLLTMNDALEFVGNVKEIVLNYAKGKLSKQKMMQDVKSIYEDNRLAVEGFALCKLYREGFKEANRIIIEKGQLSKLDALDEVWFYLCGEPKKYWTPLYYLDRPTYMDAVGAICHHMYKVEGMFMHEQEHYLNNSGITHGVMCLLYMRDFCSRKTAKECDVDGLLDKISSYFVYDRKAYDRWAKDFSAALVSLRLIQPNKKKPFLNEVRYFSLYPNLDWDEVVKQVMTKLQKGG